MIRGVMVSQDKIVETLAFGNVNTSHTEESPSRIE
jgi:hypothetical protein